MATTRQTASNNPTPEARAPKRKTHGKPAAVVGFGSVKVPVYRCASGGRIRFAISYHREGRRMRQFFTDLAAAKKEALLVAQRIQCGMQHLTDLKPHDRENYLAACAKLADSGIPLVAAVEDCRRQRRHHHHLRHRHRVPLNSTAGASEVGLVAQHRLARHVSQTRPRMAETPG